MSTSYPPSNPDAALDLSARVAELMPQAWSWLGDLCRLPSVHGVPEREQDCRDAAAWVQEAFAAVGIGDVEQIATSDGSIAVVGHRPARDGAPTVLLYSHYDIQPTGDRSLWTSDPFTLTARDGRWYARGAADCKGNLVAHLVALRALGPDSPVGVRVVAEGSEEAAGTGLPDLLRDRPELFSADMVLIADAGNVATGRPTLVTALRGVAIVDVTVSTLRGDVHSGLYGGAAPDALAALMVALTSLRDETGATTVDGLAALAAWSGAAYDAEQLRADAGVLDGVDLLVDGAVADQVWSGYAVTVLGIDTPSVADSVPAVPATARARVSLRVPPGQDVAAARAALGAHLRAHVPWGAHTEIAEHADGAPFAARTDGPGYALLGESLAQAYGVPVGHAGMGGSIPLCEELAQVLPDAEIALFGVEDPPAHIHAPDESVDPEELRRSALAEALFLDGFGRIRAAG